MRTHHLPCRDEIAGCIEKAYEKILFTEATRILFFNTPKKMTDYAKKVAGVQGKGLWKRERRCVTAVFVRWAGGPEGH
jgi:hypothetical protein